MALVFFKCFYESCSQKGSMVFSITCVPRSLSSLLFLILSHHFCFSFFLHPFCSSSSLIISVPCSLSSLVPQSLLSLLFLVLSHHFRSSSCQPASVLLHSATALSQHTAAAYLWAPLKTPTSKVTPSMYFDYSLPSVYGKPNTFF